MKVLPGLVMVVLVVLAGCAQAPGMDDSTTAGDHTTTPDAPRQSPPSSFEDPESDVLGWEDGRWYNESIDVNQRDGLNDSELDQVVSRSMARVEHIRGLEFEERVSVSVVSREEFSQRDRGNTSAARRQFDNQKFEALMMVGERTDSIAVQRKNSGAVIGGYYSPEKGEIVVVSENTTSPKLNEVTLSQELYHALQDQHFDLSSFDQSTRERHNAVDGLVEGDGNYVDYLYEQACKRGEWGECLQDSGGDDVGGQQLANYGPYLLKYQPYSDGPRFVKQLHEERGWEAVNALYENPPASTEQTIHPDLYGEDRPAEVTVEDRSGADWTRLEPEGRPNYGELGEAGLFSMFMYPAYESGGKSQVIPVQSFFNYEEGSDQLRAIDPLNYSHPYSDGWNGDRFVAYTNADGEGAYVWKLAWDSEAEAAEFVEGYRKLLEHRGATPVDDRRNTWRIPEDRPFGDAFSVQQRGDTVVIVNAPTVEDLPDVREGAAPAN